MKKLLRSLLLTFVFFAGFQSFCQAQMTITNQSSCTIYVSTGQEDMATAQRCDWCNIATITTILPGASVVFSRDPACLREVWSFVGWGTNMFGLTSISWNPAYQGTCSSDVFNATCSASGPALTANWVQFGAGPSRVIIN